MIREGRPFLPRSGFRLLKPLTKQYLVNQGRGRVKKAACMCARMTAWVLSLQKRGKTNMEFDTLIRERYSVRAYLDKPVEEKKLRKVLETAVLAPTAANRQAFRLIVLSTSEREKELRTIYSKDWFTQAPYVICVCSLPSQAWTRKDGKSYGDVDAAIVMDHLILAAADQGLGTCWVGAFDAQAAREVLNLPDDAEPVAFTPLGYPADKPKAKKRKALEELVTYGTW